MDTMKPCIEVVALQVLQNELFAMLGTSNLLSTIFYLKSYLNPSLTKYPHKVQLKIPSSQIGQARRRSPATWQVPVQFAHSIL